MKKLIIVLAIAIVLVGAVFATDSSLIVKATLAELAPTFGLTTTDTDVSSITMATYANSAAVVNGTASAITAATGYATITDASVLTEANGSVTVTFSVLQISDSSTTRHYHLSAQATNLVRVKDPATNSAVNGGAGQIGLTSAFSGNNAIDANDMIPVDGGTNGIAVPAVVAGANSAVADYATNHVMGEANSTTSTQLDLTYDGVRIKVTSSSTFEVGKFDVKWNANNSARPGDYEACVVLTVSAD